MLPEKNCRIGNEFGATTGRPRRCGWIDLVALRYACMINGVTQIVMTKADVLDSFAELSVCTAYEVEGKKTTEIPYQLERTKPNPCWEKFPGWSVTTSACKTYASLPDAMKTYVNFINTYLGVDVKYISNGPGRDQLVSVSN